MEEGKSTCERGRKKTVRIGGGGCVRGVVLWGGVLAAATLIAAFTINRRWGRPSKKDMCKRLKKDNEGEGLRSVLQTSAPSVHPNPCCRSDGTSEMDVTQIGTLELDSTQSLFLEEKPVLEINGEKEITIMCGDKEILLSDNSKPEDVPSCDNYGINVKDFTLPVVQLDQDINKNDSGKDTAAIEVKKEDEAGETLHAEQVEVGEEEDVAEKGKESSEGTGGSSMEFIAEPIWLTEFIEELKINFQNSGEKIEDTPSIKTIGMEKKDEEFKTFDAEQIKDDPPKQSAEEEDDDEEVEIVVEKGEESFEKIEDTPSTEVIEVTKEDEEDEPIQSTEEDFDDENEEESSEGTGDSSMESNTDPVWPTESIERLSMEFNEMKNNSQNSVEKIAEDGTVKKEDDSHKNSGKDGNTDDLGNNSDEITEKSMMISKKRETSELVTKNDQPVKSRIWIWSMLVLVLLLLLLSLTHHEAMSRYLLNGDSFIVP